MTPRDDIPGDPASREASPSARQRARYGIALFALYFALYAGFVLLNAFRPSLMEWRPFGGVNLAILYGLALIGAAFGLAVLYDILCGRLEAREGPGRGQGE